MLTYAESRENHMRDNYRTLSHASLPDAISAARGLLSPTTIGPPQHACDGAVSRRAPITEAVDTLGYSVQSLRDRFEILVQRLAPIMPPAGPVDPNATGDGPRCQGSELSERLRDYEGRIRSLELWIVDVLDRVEV